MAYNPLELYHLQPGSQASPITKQDVFDTVATSLNLGNNRISPSGIVSRNVVLGGKTFFLAPGEQGSIQRAINILSLKGGGTLHLGAGTYLVDSTITVPSNINIVGDSADLTFVDFMGTSAQFSVVGSNAYTTGTAAFTNGSDQVVGTLTVWTSAMIGRSIMSRGFWYEITEVADTTHLTIEIPFSEETVSGVTYVIATIVSGVYFSDMTVQNSTAALIRCRYTEGPVFDSVGLYEGLTAIDADDTSYVQVLNGDVAQCGSGVELSNSHFGTFDNTSVYDITAGSALLLNDCNSWGFATIGIQSVVGTAISLTTVSDTSFEAMGIANVTGIGCHFVTGNSDIGFTDDGFSACSSDGMKFSGTNTLCTVVNCTFFNNTGWGVNISDANCSLIGICNNPMSTNTAGNLQDLGTNNSVVGNPGV